jgi:hypothetical protein
MSSSGSDADNFLVELGAQANQETLELAEGDIENAFLNQCAADLEQRMAASGVDTVALRTRLREAVSDEEDPAYDPLDLELFGIANALDRTLPEKAFASGLPVKFIKELDLPEEDRPEIKLDIALKLMSSYGAAASLELRRLMDELVPEGQPVADLTEVDLELSPAGQKNTRQLAVLALQNDLRTNVRPDVEEQLERTLGHRDDTGSQSLTVAMYAMFRISGHDYESFFYDRVEQLLARYPHGREFLTNLIGNISDSMAAKFPEAAKPRDNWPAIFNRFENLS